MNEGQIADYLILDKPTHESLQVEVVKFLKLGWELHGGLAVGSQGGHLHFFQAIVLRISVK